MTSYVLGGGCFWCLDALYRQINGVMKVESGYAGADGNYPTYHRVAFGKTGFAEVVRVSFDESVIPHNIILDLYFLMHNPTTPNRQGADVGSQYRSIMLYKSEKEKESFQAAKERAQILWDNPIVTEISPLTQFFLAEPEHQDYFNKNPESGYCAIVIDPKLTKARSAYGEWFREKHI